MNKFMTLFLSLILPLVLIAQDNSVPTIANKTKSMQVNQGYFTFYWDNATGKIWIEIAKFEHEFLYINSLAAGIGSNDIGLDRGQLGDNKVVQFERIGNKILLFQNN